MKRAFSFVSLVAALAIVTGCQKKGEVAVNESVTDVGASGTDAFGGPQAPAPVAPEPVVYDNVNTQQTGDAAIGNIPSGNYTVKRGDTLYGIARQRYGDGKQWMRIADANPGLTPEKLRAGQTIVIP